MTVGYQVPSFDEIRAGAVAKWKSKFGENADTSSDTVDGLIIDIASEQLRLVHEGIGKASAANHVATSEGLQVDSLLAPLFGVERVLASKTLVDAYIYGTIGTVISASSIASTIDTQAQFELLYPVTIIASLYMVIVVSNQPSAATCSVTIGASTVTPTLPLGGSVAAAATLVSALNGMFTVDSAETYGLDSAGRAIVVVRMTSALSWTVSGAAVATGYAATQAQYRALVEGPVSCATGTLTVPSGYTGVVNIVPGSPGRLAQTDAEYKAAHGARIMRNAKATQLGLEQQLLALTYVVACRVYMNTTMSVVNSRPPKSFEAIVEGGFDDEIAEVIMLNHTTGTESYGSSAVDIVDSRGLAPVTRRIYFSRPNYTYVWFSINLQQGAGFPRRSLTDIASEIREAVGELGETVGIGSIVYYQRIVGLVQTLISGVALCTVQTATTPSPVGSPTFSVANVVPDERTRPVLDAGRVYVTFT